MSQNRALPARSTEWTSWRVASSPVRRMASTQAEVSINRRGATLAELSELQQLFPGDDVIEGPELVG